MPECLRSEIIPWGYYSKVACILGLIAPRFLLNNGSGGHLWLATFVFLFWLARSVLFLSLPIDPPLLQLLSVSSKPWSHISLDFVLGLPPSQGNTVVLTVVDRFLKATHFISLPKLLSARETAVAVIDHVFCIHGIPMDIVFFQILKIVLSFVGGDEDV